MTTVTCKIDGCNRLPTKRGYCDSDYQRQRKSDPEFHQPRQPKKTVCSINDNECSAGGMITRDLCQAHYQRWLKANRKEQGRLCSVESCPYPVLTVRSGLCSAHNQRLRKHGDVQANKQLKGQWAKIGAVCAFDRCGRKVDCNGYCDGHNAQMKRGVPFSDLRPLKITRKRGTGHLTKDGYIQLQVNGRKLGEHCHIMEQFIGRELFPDETVHHLNGIRSDNRIENLELKPSSHGKGQSISDLLAWAHEIIDRYEGTNVAQTPYVESRSATHH